jgi:hypothetical protein
MANQSMTRALDMSRRGFGWLMRALTLAAVAVLAAPGIGAQDPSETSTPQPSQQSQAPPPAGTSSVTPAQAPATMRGLPRGKKLMLKDGSFQLVREYQVEGDRVRYYSVDGGQWEVIPEALVDWDATKKVADQETAHDATIMDKAHVQEQGRRAEPLDIDASIEAAEGVFLPPGEGLFIFDGKAISPLTQADTDSKLSKKKLLEKVLVPVPVIPVRHNLSIHGAHAKVGVKPGQTEFYMRTADGREPELDLVRAKIHGDSREVAHLDELFKQQAASGDTISIQRWQLAPGVYRFTLSQALAPGEYALVEIVQSAEMSIYVWDFAIEPGVAADAQKSK